MTITSFFNNIQEKWLINLTDTIIPDQVQKILSLGQNFSPPFVNKKHVPVLEILKNFESRSFLIEADNRNEARLDLTNLIMKNLNNKKHVSVFDKTFIKHLKTCNDFLAKNKQLLITRADKGQSTVIINRDDYNNKMVQLLNDEKTYKKLNISPLKNTQNEVNNMVKRWHNNKWIDDKQYRQLICHNGNLPRCYGLPKIHKDGNPLRIIISAIGSPTYKISNYIHNILVNSIPKPTSYIKDSWKFVDTIRDLKINEGNFMMSLDVKSLFTNLPKHLILMGIRKC